MKPTRILPLLLFIGINSTAQSQELDKSTTISVLTGGMNYQGDVKPDNFTFQHSNFAAGIIIRKPLNRWFALRAGAIVGKISGADRWNTEELKPRNLSFTSTIKEAHLALEISILDMSTKSFT